MAAPFWTSLNSLKLVHPNVAINVRDIMDNIVRLNMIIVPLLPLSECDS